MSKSKPQALKRRMERKTNLISIQIQNNVFKEHLKVSKILEEKLSPKPKVQVSSGSSKIIQDGLKKIAAKEKKEKTLSISKHAVERFRQRIENVSTEDIQNILINKKLIAAYRKKGDGKFNIYGDVVVVIEDFKIVTIYKKVKSPIANRNLKRSIARKAK